MLLAPYAVSRSVELRIPCIGFTESKSHSGFGSTSSHLISDSFYELRNIAPVLHVSVDIRSPHRPHKSLSSLFLRENQVFLILGNRTRIYPVSKIWICWVCSIAV